MAYWQKQHQIERNKEIYDYYIDNSPITYADVGKVFGISRSRAHRIIKKLKEEYNDGGKEV